MSLDRIKELAIQMATLQSEIDERKQIQTSLQKELDELRNKVIPDLMDEEDLPRMTLKGIGTLSLFPMASVKQVEGAGPSIRQYLTENGWGDIVVPTVNASTLRSLVLEQMKEGHVFPEDLFNITTWTQARIRKG